MPRQKGYKHSEETKKKIGQGNKGRKGYWSGKKRSEEFKKRISETNKRMGYKPPSPKGRKMSEATKQKLREINKGKEISDETRRKISISLGGTGILGRSRDHNINRKKAFERLAERKKPEKCEICSSMGVICWDHDHRTEKFRGWICKRCNSILGFSKDNPELLVLLADYIRKHNN